MIALGVDVGTTRIKVLALDIETRATVTLATAETPVYSDGTGDVHRPREILEVVIALLATVVGRLPRDDVRCLSVASVGEEVVLLDAEGAPLGDTVAWYDDRGQEQATSFMSGEGGALALSRRLPPDASFSLFKLQWLRDERSADVRRAVTWTDLGDYVLRGLGGALVMDWSHASRAGAFDLDARAWDSETIGVAGLDLEFPALVPSGAAIGAVDARMARQLGLAGPVSLVAGGHDHLCAARGAGVGSNDLFLSAGTSEAHLALLVAPIVSASGRYRLDQGCFVDEASYYAHVNMHSGRIFTTWRERLYGQTPDSDVFAELDDVHRDGDTYAFAVDDDLRSGRFVDQPSDDTSRAELLSAVLDGLAERSADIVSFLEACRGRPFDRIVAAGHPPQQPAWQATRGARYSHPISTVTEAEITAYGAALLAASSTSSVSTQTTM